MKYRPMPLLNTEYEIGSVKVVLERFENPEEKDVATAEYYYFSGKPEQAVNIAEKYLDNTDEAIKLSAFLIYAYANISLGRVQQTKFAIGYLKEMIKRNYMEKSEEKHAIGAFFVTVASVLLHLPIQDIPNLTDYITVLPEGLKAYAGYVLAHQAYLEQDYGRSVGIAETVLLLNNNKYPITSVYLNLILAASLMGMRDTKAAKERFMNAWELAREDELLEPFGEHHGLLYGLIETCLKKDYSKEYEEIISITYRFSDGWRRVHNPIVDDHVADNLTTTEFTVAMLASRGWTNAEISQYMNLSVHTVKRYISDVYQKLGISSRKELHQFMLQ